MVGRMIVGLDSVPPKMLKDVPGYSFLADFLSFQVFFVEHCLLSYVKNIESGRLKVYHNLMCYHFLYPFCIP